MNLVQVDRDVTGMRPVRGPFRINTDHGNFFIWFGMGVQFGCRNSGRVFIRLLRAGNAVNNYFRENSCPLTSRCYRIAIWPHGICTVLLAVYQEVGLIYYNRSVDEELPRLQEVGPFWRYRTRATHQQDLCQTYREGFCQRRNQNCTMGVIHRNARVGPVEQN